MSVWKVGVGFVFYMGRGVTEMWSVPGVTVSIRHRRAPAMEEAGAYTTGVHQRLGNMMRLRQQDVNLIY